MLGEAVVSNVIVGFEDSQPVIESLELPFHVGGYGVELDLRELAAGVEVDGAGAAKLCGIASVDERGALGFRDGAGLDVIGLREELIDEDLGIEEEAGDIRPDRGLQLLTLDRGADALASERAAVGHGAVAPVARPPGPGTAEGEAADGAADEGAEQVGMARVAGQGAVALEGSDGGVPDVLRD